MDNSRIAIVGLDCRYPGANSPQEFWENIVNKRQQFRNMPEKRLDLNYYGSDSMNNEDTTYVKKAAVLTNYSFDRIKYRISKSTFEQTDMTQWLALDVAAGALRDAGFENGNGLDKSRTGVIIGNSLNGEFTRANIMRLRWPYVFKVLESTLSNLDYNEEDIQEILTKTERVYKEPFPVPDADTLAGGLSNTIAGRICNYFDFNGGGYTIDGACSSSLLAITSACNAIFNGEMDVALVGGVDLSIDPFEMIGFARNGALAKESMEVFSSKSQGFWPGEGCGVAVIMKESEALERGLNIYSVIAGWGISSDGKGGVTRPKAKMQQLALQRAYKKAGYDSSTVSMFEAHGTGTPLGDEVELTALTDELRGKVTDKIPVVGSVKNLIGHTKAAAGIAGLIKAALATKYKVIPPVIRGDGEHPVLEANKDCLKLSTEKTVYDEEEPMRTGVSSFGFGGINVHITMEENSASVGCLEDTEAKEGKQLFDHQIFPFATVGKELLLDQLIKIEKISKDISKSELIDLSGEIVSKFRSIGHYKGCLVVSGTDELKKAIVILIQHITDKETEQLIDTENGIFYQSGSGNNNIAFLFPGQGAPIYNNSGVFSGLEDVFLNGSRELGRMIPQADQGNKGIVDTSIAQPSIVKSTIQSTELLRKLGVQADFAIGHSLGEISALNWAKVVSQESAVEIAMERGRCMSEFAEAGGAMLALQCEEEQVHQLIKDTEAIITGFNGKGNYVVGGKMDEIETVESNAFNLEIRCARLKVSNAFHTPLMVNAAQKFKEKLNNWKFNEPNKSIISTVLGEILPKEIDLKEYLFDQIEKPVKFTQAIEQIRNEVNVFIEVGPGNTLRKTLKNDSDLNIISLNYGGDSVKGLLQALAACFVNGSNVNFSKLASLQFYRNFDSNNWSLDVLVNPCEKIDFKKSDLKALMNKESIVSSNVEKSHGEQKAINTIDDSEEGVLNHLKKLISDKTEIPIELILNDNRITSQLHLNSLVITEILSILTKSFGKSHKVYSEASIVATGDGTLAEISKLVHQGENGGATNSGKQVVNFEEHPNWTQVFTRVKVDKKKPRIKLNFELGTILLEGNITADVQGDSRWTDMKTGDTALFIYEGGADEGILKKFLSFLQKSEVQKGKTVALVEIRSKENKIDLKPVFRSFVQEFPLMKYLSLELDQNIEDKVAVIIEEIESSSKYKEVTRTLEGNRSESQVEVMFPKAGDLQDAISSNDIILATGGGKGITFESILALGISTGAKLAILGRSLPKNDKQLEKNLQLLSENNVEFKYYSADVCSEEDIKFVCNEVSRDLGEVTVVLHGAGVNNPKIIANLNPEDFKATAKVKVDGLKNVINSLEVQKLKTVIGYGSIIAQSGMQGNADYAFANDQLAKYIDTLHKENEKCRCLTFEWSVWDETGMGANLNSIQSLKEKGIWPIPVRNGIQILINLLSDLNCKNGRWIVAGRYGKVPTLNFKSKKKANDRFLSNVLHQVPGVEIVTDVSVNLIDDVYLKNHVFRGQYVFPTVMILEGMAQCCNELSGNKASWQFQNLKINKSIFIPENGNNKVRFIVSRLSENEFRAVVRSEDSSFEVNCFEADVIFKKEKRNVEPLDFNSEFAINIEENFYDDLLFHHGGFRRISQFRSIHLLGAVASVSTFDNDKWFGEFISENKILGDPGLNDAAIHCHQACRPSQQLLPTSAEEIYISSISPTGQLSIQTKELEEVNGELIVDVIIVDEIGVIQQEWRKLVLASVSGVDKNLVWIPELLVSYLEYQSRKVTGIDKYISNELCEEILISLKKNIDVQIPLDEEIELYLSSRDVSTEQIDNSLYSNKIRLDGIETEFQLLIQKKKELENINLNMN